MMTSFIDKFVCSVCGARAIYPFSICLECLEWSSSILAFSSPGARPVSAGRAQGFFRFPYSNTGGTYRTRYIRGQNHD